MFQDAFRSSHLCTDATGALVLAPERRKHGHFWALIARDEHVLYRYSSRHNGAAIDRLLAGYEGYLVADTHVVYDHVYRDGDIVEVAYWAHLRRHRFESLDSDPDRAKVALAHIAALFQIHRTIAGSPRKKREWAR